MSESLYDQSAELLRKHARSFRLASVFLPADRARDAALIYAFCRTVDDTVDEAADPATAEADLSALEADFRAEAPRVELHALLRRRCEALGLPLRPFLALIEGVRGDLYPVRIADEPALIRYGWHVAGTVGWMMCAALNVQDPRALPHAMDLGIAMQLTNICRDVTEDAERGRVYLPATLLAEIGESPETILTGQYDPQALGALLVRVVDHADRWYASGRAGIAYLPWRCQLAIHVAASLYRGIGRRLSRDPRAALRQRTVLPTWEKAVCIVDALLRFTAGGLRGVPAHDPQLHQSLDGLPGLGS